MNMNDMLAIKKATDSLRGEELKSFLRLILAKIKILKEQEEFLEGPAADLVDLYNGLMNVQEKRGFWDPVPDCTHVHIVIGDSFAGSMKQSLSALGWSDTHKVIPLRENYAIGPLRALDSYEGRQARSEWFRDHITEAFEDYTEFEKEYQELLNKIEQIPRHAEIMIWAGSNACEQIGLRHALYLLRTKSNKLVLLDACLICERLYNRSDTTVNYLHSGEIPTDKLQNVLLRKDGGNRLSEGEITRFTQEWQGISEQTGILRLWLGGAVVEVPSDYYDQYLLEKLDSLERPAGDNGFLKSARLIGEAVGHCDQYIGDSYFEFRLRELIYDGVLEIKGLPAAMRFYSVRRKSNVKGL